MGIDHTRFSPRVQQKIVHAGVNSPSYQQGARDLAELSDLNIAPKPVERLVRKIGQERIDQRDAAVAVHEQLPLMAKDVVANPTRSSPSVAMVSVDGGRLQIRSDPSEPKQDSHWRESKVSVLETYHSDVHEADPDPDVPRCFFDLKRTKEMVRGLGHPLPVGLEFQDECQTRKQEEATEKRHSRKPRPGRPKRLVRSVLASRKCAEEFGPMVHQAAWERNFFGAKRRAFLGDGLPVNWTIQRRHFASFTPILDFVHALSYVFSAANVSRERTLSSSPRVDKIDLLSASVYLFIDTDNIVPHNSGMGYHSSAAIFDGAGLAAQIFWCGDIFWFGLARFFVINMVRQWRINACGRCARSFLRTSLFFSNRRFVPDHRSAAGSLPLFAERFECA